MKFEKKNILIISPERWGKSFVSKHHYASELASSGNTVFFLNPPGNVTKVVVSEVKKNLFVIDYKHLFRGINYLPRSIRHFFSKLEWLRLSANLEVSNLDVVWSFDPYRFQNLQLFNAKIKIYHSVDVHKTNLEFEVAQAADVIFTSSEKISEKFKKLFSHCFKINHGLAQHFIDFLKAEVSLPGNFDIKVGYVGNILYSYLDKITLLKIIEFNPKIGFYLIGPFTNKNNDALLEEGFIAKLRKFENVFFLGVIPSSELPNYLRQFDLFLMCYLGNKYVAELANPHKILEFLSTGKVVVSHYIDEYKDKSELINMALRNEDLQKLFAETIRNLDVYNSEALIRKRIDFAFSNSYKKQIKEIEKIITHGG